MRAATVAAVAAGVVGLATGNAAVLLLGVVPLAYAAFGHASGLPEPRLRVERSVSEREPDPGETVTVAVTVENVGDAPLPDLRVSDAPPPGVPTEGDVAVATALRPGESTRLEYELSPPRGTHEFGDARVAVRNLAGTAVDRREQPVEGDATVTCQTLLDDVRLRDRTIQYVGRTPTDEGGAGVEFYATREYRRGDPLSRVDWARYARTGELATVELREERAVTVVFLVDDRADVQRAQPGYGPDTLDLAAYFVSRATRSLLADNHRVGLATVDGLSAGLVGPGGGEPTRVATDARLDRLTDPRASADGGTAAEEGSTERKDRDPSADTGSRQSSDGPGDDDAAAGTETGGSQAAAPDAGVAVRAREAARTLVADLPPGAQVVCCTPLTDGFAPALARALRGRDRSLTVVSPDMSTAGARRTPGERAVLLRRRERIHRLERRGVPVVDWDLDEPIAMALAGTFGHRPGTVGPRSGRGSP